MFLREFLYVDTEKTRGLLAQLNGGIDDTSTNSTSQNKQTTAGPRGIAQHGVSWGTQSQISKSLGDALFPSLEEQLESEGLLTDVSDNLLTAGDWAGFAEAYPPGSIIRITAPASLFDARYVATALAGMGTIVRGLVEMGVDVGATAQPPQQGGPSRGQGSGKKPAPRKPLPTANPGELEDAIPDFPSIGPLSPALMRAMTQVARGMFKPGVHMVFRPSAGNTPNITVRLQEGRSYLDSDSEVLFARFGLAAQNWTLVGSVGHYPASGAATAPTLGNLASGQSISRANLLDGLNATLEFMGSLGFADLPQYPGFSVVPFAVYRGTESGFSSEIDRTA